MKKLIILLILLMAIPLFSQDIVRIYDRMGREVYPGMSERWPVSHLNGGVAGVKMLLSAPGNSQSHYVTGFILSGAQDPNGFYLLRQNCILLDAAADNMSLTEDGTTFDWDTKGSNGDFSLELWIKYEATTTAAPALIKTGDETNNGWLLETTAASLVKFTFDDGSNDATITGATAIDDGEWHHIVVSVDRSSTTGLNLYVDGEADTTTAVNPGAVTAAVNVGSHIVVTGVDSSEIYISGLGIYLDADSFLTLAEVRTRYNGGIGMKFEGDESGLLVGYNLDEGVSTACYDIKNAVANVIGLTATAWVPSRQNAATAEVNEAGIPFNSNVMMRRVGKFHCGGTGTVAVPKGGQVFIEFPHPVKIGRNSSLNILETIGAFDLVLFGYTGPN